MKKIGLLFVVFAFLFFLSGCKTNNEEIIDAIGASILSQLPDEVEEDLDLTFSYEDYVFEYTITSDKQAVLSDAGEVLDRSEDTIVEYTIEVTFKGESRVFTKTMTVLMSEEAKLEKIQDFSTQVRQLTPINTTSNISFPLGIEGEEVEIVYNSEVPEVLSNEGVVNQQTINRNVKVNYTITYKGVSRDFTMFVLVYRVPEETQIANIQDWLESELTPLFAAESGKLPTVEGLYGYQINWLSDYPGVINLEGELTPAYEGKQITLIGEARINLIDAKFTFTYTSQGISETINEVEYIDSFFTNLMPLSVNSRTNIMYEEDLNVIQSIVAPNTITRLRPSDPNNASLGRKMPGGPQYVVIHDTGNTSPGGDAEMHNRYIHNQASSPTGRVASWHYTIDDKEVYQHVPDDEIAWHAGDGSVAFGQTWSGGIGGGNLNGIGIETCVNPENDYELTLRRTAKLTAQLLHKYDLGIDRVKQHYDFSGKTCPARIRGQGIWYDFLKMVERELLLIIVTESDNAVQMTWTINNPELIGPGGEVLYRPIQDQTVSISLEVVYGEFTKSYEYTITVAGMTLERKIQEVLFLLRAGTVKTTTEDILLIQGFEDFGATISWQSSHPDILTNTGVYNKPTEKTRVTLTATILIEEIETVEELVVLVS